MKVKYIQQIASLQELRNGGAITDAEFASEKAKVLVRANRHLDPKVVGGVSALMGITILGGVWIGSTSIQNNHSRQVPTATSSATRMPSNGSASLASVSNGNDVGSVENPTSDRLQQVQVKPRLNLDYIVGSWNPYSGGSDFNCDVSDVDLTFDKDNTYSGHDENLNVEGSYKFTQTGVTAYNRVAGGISGPEPRGDFYFSVEPINHRFAVINGSKYFRCKTVTGD